MRRFTGGRAVTTERMNLLYVLKESSGSVRLAREKNPSYARLTKSEIIADKSCTRSPVKEHFSASPKKGAFLSLFISRVTGNRGTCFARDYVRVRRRGYTKGEKNIRRQERESWRRPSGLDLFHKLPHPNHPCYNGDPTDPRITNRLLNGVIPGIYHDTSNAVLALIQQPDARMVSRVG